MITGDLNYPNIDWASWSASDGDSGSNLFLEALEDDFLFQHVTFPTRARNGQRPSILDLIITYEGNVIDNLTATDPLGKSYHYMLECKYVCSCDEYKFSTVRYLYDKGHYQSFTEELLNTN